MAYLYEVHSPDDFEEYYRIKCDEPAIQWGGWQSAPDRERLRIHFLRLLKEQIPAGDRLLFLRDDTGEAVGYDLLHRIDAETIESAGHSILSEHQGHGYGTLLFELLVPYARSLGYRRFTGWISERNIGSIRNVERNGFRRTEAWRTVELPAFGRSDRFYLWERAL